MQIYIVYVYVDKRISDIFIHREYLFLYTHLYTHLYALMRVYAHSMHKYKANL